MRQIKEIELSAGTIRYREKGQGEDRLFPIEHGRRLSRLFPNARLEEIPDNYTFVPIDQPARLASLLREFTESTKPQRQASDTKGEP